MTSEWRQKAKLSHAFPFCHISSSKNKPIFKFIIFQKSVSHQPLQLNPAQTGSVNKYKNKIKKRTRDEICPNNLEQAIYGGAWGSVSVIVLKHSISMRIKAINSDYKMKSCNDEFSGQMHMTDYYQMIPIHFHTFTCRSYVCLLLLASTKHFLWRRKHQKHGARQSKQDAEGWPTKHWQLFTEAQLLILIG